MAAVSALDRSFFCNVWGRVTHSLRCSPSAALVWGYLTFGASVRTFSTCYCSLRTFSGLALVLFFICTCKLLLTNLLNWRCVVDAKSISSKSNSDQIRLRHPCGVLMLKCCEKRWKGKEYFFMLSGKTFFHVFWQKKVTFVTNGYFLKRTDSYMWRFDNWKPKQALYFWNAIPLMTIIPFWDFCSMTFTM